MDPLRKRYVDLVDTPSHDLLLLVEQMQRHLSADLNPRQLQDRTSPGRMKDLQILRNIAQRPRDYPNIQDVDERLHQAYAYLTSRESFERQIEQVERLATKHESILTLYELLDVWNHVGTFVEAVTAQGTYPSRKVLLATSAHRSLNIRTFLTPDREVQVILFFERIFAFVEHVAYILPLAIPEAAMQSEDLFEFPQIVSNRRYEIETSNPSLELAVKRLFHRYVEGEWKVDQTWTHGFGEYTRLVAQDMSNAIQFFVIAHELAHGLCQHEGMDLMWNLTSEAKFTEVERNWDQELEADYVGFLLGKGIAALHGIPIETYSWACYLFFKVLACCSPTPPKEQAELTVDQKYQRHQTHPPFHQRLTWLEEIIRQEKSSDISTSGIVSLDPIKTVCRTVDRLMSST